MPAKIITTSPNIASLDSLINFSLCSGNITVDVTPSVFIGGNSINILGVSVKIINPAGIIIHNYPTSGYDINNNDSPPLTSSFTYPIPTQAGNFQYGTYTIDVMITDADGTDYVVSKVVKICVPDVNHKTRNYGSLSAKLSGICKEEKVYVEVDTPPNYNGAQFESVVNSFKLLYPTVSQIDAINTTVSSFSVQIYEGEYKLTGNICAKYNIGDNVYNEVNYKVKALKDIKCIIDECCVLGKLVEFNNALKESCSDAETEGISSKIFDTLRLLKTAQLAAECGEDASDYINDLESILGCQCTCNCNEGVPIINSTPSKDFIINGCNVVKETIGLTDTYTIDNYEYVVTVTGNGGILTVSSASLNGCTKSTQLAFNIAPLYTQIKALANTDFASWAAITNKAWNTIDPICLGLTPLQWSTMSYLQRGQAIVDTACKGGSCNSIISTDAKAVSGSDVNISWNEVSGVYSVDVYMDDVFKGNVLAGIEVFKIIGAADNQPHTYSLISKCANGVIGNALDGSFTYYGCPTIAPISVSSIAVVGATCPFNISTLVSGLPSGIDAEWHTLNNTNNSSIVTDETAVSGGTYYVFAKDTNGCYSLGKKVTVACSEITNCTAPQNLIVEAITGSFRVRFSSATYPPASYTVKRKPFASPDVDGSYTTIGTPTYNAGLNKWEIIDNTGSNNTLYTYKAISNCDTSSPAILYNFANILCPALVLTPNANEIGYSFVPSGGQIDKYEVEIWNLAGTTRISFDTHVPSFANPTVGTFLYLTSGTSYKVRIKSYIGTYVRTCDFQNIATISVGTNILINNFSPLGVIDAVSLFFTITGGSYPITSGGDITGVHSGTSTAISVLISGSLSGNTLSLYKNGVLQETKTPINSSGTQTFAPVTFSSMDDIGISFI